MVGSMDSIASANIILDTIVAEQFRDAADVLEKADNFRDAVHDYIKKLLSEHQRIIFNGNGYSQEWVEEAERRGLPNLRSMVDAIPALTTDKAIRLFEEFGIYTRKELESRKEIEYEQYAKVINIEARAMINIAGKQIIPAVIQYTTRLAESINQVSAALPDADISVQKKLLKEASTLLGQAENARVKLLEDVEKTLLIRNAEEKAMAYHEKIVPDMRELRTPVDKLEKIVAKELWPYPSYGDLIFEVSEP